MPSDAHADIKPKKAPETTAAIREQAAKYRTRTMTITTKI
jgi:hypothetical protein